MRRLKKANSQIGIGFVGYDRILKLFRFIHGGGDIKLQNLFVKIVMKPQKECTPWYIISTMQGPNLSKIPITISPSFDFQLLRIASSTELFEINQFCGKQRNQILASSFYSSSKWFLVKKREKKRKDVITSKILIRSVSLKFSMSVN